MQFIKDICKPDKNTIYFSYLPIELSLKIDFDLKNKNRIIFFNKVKNEMNRKLALKHRMDNKFGNSFILKDRMFFYNAILKSINKNYY